MKKITISIPSGKRYVSEIDSIGGRPWELPDGVLNKQITGCGATTFALTCPDSYIILSPRIKLIENKHDQFPDTTLMMTGDTKDDDIRRYLEQFPDSQKILSTNDSFPRFVSVAAQFYGVSQEEVAQRYRVLVDEFHVLLRDSAIKADVEFRMLEKLKIFPHVCYMSATPILDHLLEMIPYFNNIPYYQLEWADKEQVQVVRHKCNKPVAAAQRIVESYMKGDFPFVEQDNGETFFCKEAYIYLSSVTNIVNIVKNTGLKAEDVNIIVADNEENQKLIRQLGEDYKMGKLPKRGEPSKMITMLTSTAFAGVDAYSTCAATFVVSDCRRACTSLDISLELTQIAGRQRLNYPGRDRIYFFYTTLMDDTTEEDFRQEMQKKIDTTKLEVNMFNSCLDDRDLNELTLKKDKLVKKALGYDLSYTMFNEQTGRWEENSLAKVSDYYAHEVRKMQFQNGISVRRYLLDTGRFSLDENQQFDIYDETVAMTVSRTTFVDKMETYCRFRQSESPMVQYLLEKMNRDNPELQVYYEQLGADRIKALNYQESKLKTEFQNIQNTVSIASQVKSSFREGDRLTRTELKQRIQQLYDNLGMKKTAKATDIRHFGFEMKDCKVRTPEGKRISSVELIKNF